MGASAAARQHFQRSFGDGILARDHLGSGKLVAIEWEERRRTSGGESGGVTKSVISTTTKTTMSSAVPTSVRSVASIFVPSMLYRYKRSLSNA